LGTNAVNWPKPTHVHNPSESASQKPASLDLGQASFLASSLF